MYDQSTLCPYPWNHFSVNPDSSMRLCCNGGAGAVVKGIDQPQIYLDEITSVEQYFNLPSMKEIRRKMVRGERSIECQVCYHHEDQGGVSFRQMAYDTYSDKVEKWKEEMGEDGSIDPEVQYMDFAMGNNCNLKCRMCNPTNTKLIKEEFEKINSFYIEETYQRSTHGWKETEQLLKVCDELLVNAERFLFTGGEPFIIKLHYDILQRAVEIGRAKHLTLSYHTNLTVLPKKITELWRHFKEVKVYGSIDAIGGLNDYVRHPSKWHITDKNLRKLIDLKSEVNLWIEVHTVIQAYTFPRLTEVLEYMFELRHDIPPIPFFNYLTFPQELSAECLPRSLVEKSVRDIFNFIETHKREYFLNMNPRFKDTNMAMFNNLDGHLNRLLNSPQRPYSDFLSYTKKLDGFRSENLYEVLPELYQYENKSPTQVATPT